MTPFPQALKSWRQMRRRSQLDLALLACISQRHLSFLESGRAAPSRHMVLQLGEALELPLRTQNELLQAAGYAPFYSLEPLGSQALAPVQEAIAQILSHHAPMPALVVDRDWQLLHANAGMANLLAACGLDDSVWQAIDSQAHRNVMRLTLHPRGLRPFIDNLDEVMWHLCQRARREAAMTQRDGAWRAIEDVVSDRPIPSDRALAPVLPILPIRLSIAGVRLQLFTTLTTFGTPQDVTTDELRIESFYPLDAPTRSWFEGMVALGVNGPLG